MKEFRLTPEDGIDGLRQALSELNGQGAEILLTKGIYYVEDSIAIGKDQSHVTIRGEEGTRIVGGRKLSGWHKVERPEVLERLDETARDKVYVCDLAANGVKDPGHFSRRGFGGDSEPAHGELYLDGEPMFVAQYPKRGTYLPISGYEREIINECEEAIGDPEYGFYYDDPRPRRWKSYDNLWVHGYWCWDWANSYEHVTQLDAEKGIVKLKEIPKGKVRGFKPNQRFYFLNILEEVNQPGDYYVDTEAMLLYFYPEALGDESELLFSTLDTPMFSLSECEGVVIRDLQLECMRERALYAVDSSNIRVTDCCLRGIGNTALDMEGGENNTICGCTIYNCGDGGIRIVGGDRMTLTPAGSRVTNNHIYKVALWSRCYKPAISPNGVGIDITHNLIHDCPHIAILYSGNDMRIEDNEIYSVCLETGDAGAIYSGRDVTFRGNHVSHNYIHHLGGVGMGTMGIYNDDVLSGTIMEDNFFYEVGRAVMLGGGVDYVVRNNVFVKCYPAIAMDSRAAHTEFFWTPCYEEQRGKLYDGVQSFLHANDPAVTLDCTKSPYIDRYPEIQHLVDIYESGGELTASAEFSRNVFCTKPMFRYSYNRRDAGFEHMMDCGEPTELSQDELSVLFDMRHIVRPTWSAGKGDWRFAKNYMAFPSDFVDAEWGIIGIRPDSKAMETGYQPVEFDSIGLVEEERKVATPKVWSCLLYPYRSETRKLTLGLWNAGDEAVQVEMHLTSSNPNVNLYDRTVLATLQAGEKTFLEVGDLGEEEIFCVEARSATPGVRPARAENIMGNWNRF